MITVVGMGYRDGDVSLKGAAIIDSADKVIVKTALTDTYKFFEDIEHITCDSIYEKSEDFNALNESLARYVIENEKGATVYCVNGSGIDDRSVIILKQLLPEIEIVSGVGAEMDALKVAPTTAFTAVSAYDIDDDFYYDTTKNTLVIKDIDSDYIAGVVKAYLINTVGDEYTISFFNGSDNIELPVYDIDRQSKYDYLTYITVLPCPLIEKKVFAYQDLIAIMKGLRSEHGCEWDKAQTHESIRANAIEEAFELVDAINHDDIDNIIEEAGDVILQGAFHTVIGAEDGEFEMQEVLSGLCHKLITRHPHVFGNVVAGTADKALASWTEAKAKEKKAKTAEEKLFKIADALPGLMAAEKIQKIASAEGLDFVNKKDAEKKLLEEVNEFISADDASKEDEAGDILFSIVNILRLMGVKSELALHRTNEKFKNRIVYVLREMKANQINSNEISIEDFDKLWQNAKANGL